MGYETRYGDKIYKAFQYFFLTATIAMFPLGFYIENDLKQQRQEQYQKSLENSLNKPDNSPSIDYIVNETKYDTKYD